MKKIFFLGLIFLSGFALAGCGLSQSPSVNNNITTDQNTRVFTLAELSQYTGANGSTAYIAVDGVVYDVTNVFVNGTHQGLQLGGTDATAAFAASPHSASLLATLPVVGVLGSSTSSATDTVTTTAATQPGTTTTAGSTSSSSVSTLPVFTLTDLSMYTGANGSTAYIAVDGVVYDVTNVFVNGTHQGLQLGGTDATAAFAASPHSASLLNTLTIVGTLEGYPVITISTGSTTTTASGTTTTAPATGQTLPVFTTSQLSQYTGANGSTAYIAVNGVVYDVTNVFVNGTHQGLQLGGTDATAAFAASPHSASLLATLPVVGSMEGYPLITASTSTSTTTTQYHHDDDHEDDDDDEYEQGEDD